MFNELSFNFDLTHSLKLRYFYNCIPIQTDPCQDIIKFKSYMLWFCFCFFNMYKKQLHMKARLRKDQMCFSSSSKSCKKSLGSVLAGPGWNPSPPPQKVANRIRQRGCILNVTYRGQVRWLGPEGPKAPTLGRHVSACATILRLRALLYLRASY